MINTKTDAIFKKAGRLPVSITHEQLVAWPGLDCWDWNLDEACWQSYTSLALCTNVWPSADETLLGCGV